MSTTDLPPITLTDMITELEIELRFREFAFPKRAQNAGLALRNQLRRRTEILAAIKRRLEAERDQARP